MQVAIEVNGPTHYHLKGTTEMGDSIAHTRMLQALGWKVVPIPYSAWNLLEGATEVATLQRRSEYLKIKLQEAGVDVRGYQRFGLEGLQHGCCTGHHQYYVELNCILC